MLYDDKKFIGAVIRKARKNMQLKQAELAEKVGMSEKNLGNIEAGRQFPQVNNFLRLIETLNLSLEDFGAKSLKPTKSIPQNLLQTIYLSSDKELEALMSILKLLKDLK